MSATKKLGYIGLDQYGETYHIGNNPPRKWLLNHFCRRHAEKMYCDTTDGKVPHLGYIIAGHWIEIRAVHAWKVAA